MTMKKMCITSNDCNTKKIAIFLYFFFSATMLSTWLLNQLTTKVDQEHEWDHTTQKRILVIDDALEGGLTFCVIQQNLWLAYVRIEMVSWRLHCPSHSWMVINWWVVPGFLDANQFFCFVMNHSCVIFNLGMVLLLPKWVLQ